MIVWIFLWSITRTIEKSTNKIVEKQVEQNKLLEEIKAKLNER
ncbi:hypothetical protein [Solibacillus faecavium]|nr:hypothetical protein [Solibacillus faecavium]